MNLAVKAGASVVLMALVATTPLSVLADEFADIDREVLAKRIERLAAAWTIPMAVADTSEEEIPFLDRNAENPVAFPTLKPASPLGGYGTTTIYRVFDRDRRIFFNDLEMQRQREGAFGRFFRRRFR